MRFPIVKLAFIERIRSGLHSWDAYGYDDAAEVI
jgi:hypothetical protein